MDLIRNPRLISKKHKKEMMDLGFRHSEAKCILREFRHNELNYLLDYQITTLIIFCMHDLIYAESYINHVRKYSKLFHKTSHKTKKILSSWLIKKHPYDSPKKCTCNLCNMFYTLLKLSEYTDSNNKFNKLSPGHVSLFMLMHYYHTKKYSYMGDEISFYLILFKFGRFQEDFTDEHKFHFYNNLEQYFSIKRKMRLFEKLSYDILPTELIINVRNRVLTIV